jgi:glycosyltransferase involved in cell wall biosynthesis
MRAAFLTHSARQRDAIGNQLAGKVRFLRAEGWEVRVFSELTDRLHPQLTGMTAQRTAATIWRDPDARRFLWNSDLVSAEYGTHYSLLDLLPALRRSTARIILDYHGVTPRQFWQAGDEARLAQAERMRNLVWCADLAIVRSHAMVQELHQATGYPRERIRQVPCFIHADVEKQRHQAVRCERRLEDAFVLLFVGRLAANKRVPLLVELLPRLTDLGRPVHAVVIGDHGDIYQSQADACVALARQLGVQDRLHLLGCVDDLTLHSWYATADALVLPSVHEGFCVPVVEAMSHGLPVIAARAAALPETLGDAGLSFRPDDLDDLERQIRRVLAPQPEWNAATGARPRRVAIVACRFGADFVGGAERSLRTMAETLQARGHHVEVFTTCTRHESHWTNELPAGVESVDGISVRRFPIDHHERARHLASLEALKRSPSPEAERDYLSASLHSSALLEALRQQSSTFDAIIVGPYLFGLTWDVAREFGSKVLLAPCFHNEPFARLTMLREAFAQVGGILYHTEAEKWFAEAELGLNHPYATVVGTYLSPPSAGVADSAGRAPEGLAQKRGQDPSFRAKTPGPQQAVGVLSPFLCKAAPEHTIVYCGRYTVEKGFDRFLEFATRYSAAHPGRFQFVCMGQGNIARPKAPWLVDLGFVDERRKREILEGASALVQLSLSESLSLVAREAWQAAVPVIGHHDCLVIREQIRRSGGGMAVAEYESFAAALDSLWSDPQRWIAMGAAGQRFVSEYYESIEAFGQRLEAAIDDLRFPPREQLRQRGLARAQRFDYSVWCDRWRGMLEGLVGRSASSRRLRVTAIPEAARKTANPRSGTVLVPVRVRNEGDWPAAAAGPGRLVIAHEILDERGRRTGKGRRIPLPGLIRPDESSVVVVPVTVPRQVGIYKVSFAVELACRPPRRRRTHGKQLELVVTAQENAGGAGVMEPYLVSAQRVLVEAHAVKQLPEDYQDVTQGFLAKWKRVAKQKLLHQFRRAYVDVLSRQQSAFNDKLLTALCQLLDACTALGQVVPNEEASASGQIVKRLLRQQRRTQRRLDELCRRLDELEKAVLEPLDSDERSRA